MYLLINNKLKLWINKKKKKFHKNWNKHANNKRNIYYDYSITQFIIYISFLLLLLYIYISFWGTKMKSNTFTFWHDFYASKRDLDKIRFF